MSELEERTRLYEILIRFDAKGTPSAIQRKIHEVMRQGEVIAATEELPTPIDTTSISDLMTHSAAVLLAENHQLKALLTPEQKRALDVRT